MREITVGTDRSPLSQEALRWAAGFAVSTGAKLQVVGAWQMPFMVKLPGVSADGAPTPEWLADDCEAKVAAALADLGGATVEADTLVLEGKPGPVLVKASLDSDLLVVGRTGRGKRRGFARVAEIVLGSTARHCLHEASVPIAAVPAGSTWVDTPTVVVGVDGSPGSRGALEWAARHCPPQGEIKVVRAFEPWFDRPVSETDAEGGAIHAAIKADTEDWVRGVLGDDRAVETTVVLATPQFALMHSDADLIVIGRSGTGMATRFLGSVSDHLVRYASCPVVVVP